MSRRLYFKSLLICVIMGLILVFWGCARFKSTENMGDFNSAVNFKLAYVKADVIWMLHPLNLVYSMRSFSFLPISELEKSEFKPSVLKKIRTEEEKKLKPLQQVSIDDDPFYKRLKKFIDCMADYGYFLLQRGNFEEKKSYMKLEKVFNTVKKLMSLKKYVQMREFVLQIKNDIFEQTKFFSKEGVKLIFTWGLPRVASLYLPEELESGLNDRLMNIIAGAVEIGPTLNNYFNSFALLGKLFDFVDTEEIRVIGAPDLTFEMLRRIYRKYGLDEHDLRVALGFWRLWRGRNFR